jgi:hypothetical protein
MQNAKIKGLLENREFVSVATCDFQGRPNAAPKFILKLEHNFVYLVDYTIGKTWENLKINPKASLSFMDSDTLTGYQINGAVEILESGPEYKGLLDEFRKKEIGLSAKRIVEGIYRGKTHGNFEAGFPEQFAIYKVKVEELVEIGPRGELKREKV